MAQMAKRRIRASRKGYPRFVCASEKRWTGNLGARTGHRFYNPDTGRWLNRDPLGEEGGIALYVSLLNDPQSNIDPYGLIITEKLVQEIAQMGKEEMKQWVKNNPGLAQRMYQRLRRYNSAAAQSFKWAQKAAGYRRSS
ncbi:MAG: RHS repeat-associated core domain-containing protein, partial [Limisphaerales bacterium]